MSVPVANKPLEKKPVKFSNLLLGAGKLSSPLEFDGLKLMVVKG
jgi:hypothetical protein